jgi:beta-glucosidase
MVLTSQALRAEIANATLISADCLAAPEPKEVRQKLRVAVADSEREEFEYQVATFPASLAYGKVGPNSPFWAALGRAGVAEERLRWFAANAQLPDVVGHNYYPTIEGVDVEVLATEGARQLEARLRRAAAFFGCPLYLTETSAGDTDEHKTAWMRAAHQTIAKLRQQGVAVVGMNWWPLFETLQWDYRDSVKTVAESITRIGWNNGLYLIEEQFDGTLARVRTGAADGYRDLIAAYPTG